MQNQNLLLAEAKKRFLLYNPYPKQLDFHNLKVKSKILGGGNQLGKTVAGTYEAGIIATQCYPDWHDGWRIPARRDVVSNELTRVGIVASTDSKTLRDALQQKLVGGDDDPNGAYTAGCIAPEWIVPGSAVKARGVSGGLLDSIKVKDADGVINTIYFRVYSQGRENLQAITADWVLCDEEPPQDIYAELLARISATDGYFMMCFTPLKGMTPLVQSFWNVKDKPDPYKGIVILSIYDAPHITPEARDSLVAKYSALNQAERDARLYGVPSAGVGQVYPISDMALSCTPFEIPDNWKRIAGLDFGRGTHPVACAWLAISPQGTVYVYDCFKDTGIVDSEVASKVLARGDIIITYPHDFMRSTGVGNIGNEEKSEGWAYKQVYERFGLRFTGQCAKTENGSGMVEAGIIEIRQAMLEGKFFVFSHLEKIFQEKATYFYKSDGTPSDKNDDLLDAIRYAFIMRRYAEPLFYETMMIGRDLDKAQED